MASEGYEEHLRSLLRTAKAEKRPVGIHCDRNDIESFYVSYVQSVDDEFVTCLEVSSLKRADTPSCIRIAAIGRIHLWSLYMDGVSALVENQCAADGAIVDTSHLPPSIGGALECAKDMGLLVILPDQSDDEIQGYVLSVEEGWVEIQTLKEDGSHDEILVISVDSIKTVEIGSRRAQNKHVLHRWRTVREGDV